MALRFRKSIKIAPGVKVNINKKSVGVSAGVKGAHITLNSKGRKTTSVGIPGTGLSYTSVSTKKNKNASSTTKSTKPNIIQNTDTKTNTTVQVPSTPDPIELTYTIHVKFKPAAIVRFFKKNINTEDCITDEELLQWHKILSPGSTTLDRSISDLQHDSRYILRICFDNVQNYISILDNTNDINEFFKNYKLIKREIDFITSLSKYITINELNLDYVSKYIKPDFINKFIDKMYYRLSMGLENSYGTLSRYSLQLDFNRNEADMPEVCYAYYKEKDSQYCG